MTIVEGIRICEYHFLIGLQPPGYLLVTHQKEDNTDTTGM